MKQIKQLFKNIRNDITHSSNDERITSVRNRAAWNSVLALFVTYLVLGGYSVAKEGVISPLVQLSFYIPLLVFFISNIRKDGLLFKVPGMVETDASYDQPAAVRSLPWIIVLFSIILSVDLLISIFFGTNSGDPSYNIRTAKGFDLAILVSTGLFVYFVFLIPFMYAKCFIAARVKRGDAFYMIMLLVMNLLTLGFFYQPLGQTSFLASRPMEQELSNLAFAFVPHGINLAIRAWIVYVLLRYWKEMTEVAKSFRNLLPRPTRFERFCQKVVGAVCIWIPVILIGLASVSILIGVGAHYVNPQKFPFVTKHGEVYSFRLGYPFYEETSEWFEIRDGVRVSP